MTTTANGAEEWLTAAAALPAAPPLQTDGDGSDWLIRAPAAKAGLYRGAKDHELVLDNGLVRRTFRLAPNAATVALDHRKTGEALVRSVRPEAVLVLNGQRFDIGGLIGQPAHNFLKPAWLDTLAADPAAWRCVGFQAGKTAARFPWKPRREWLSTEAPWPPPGVSLTFAFAATPEALEAATAEDRVPRERLLEEAFTTLSPEWQVHASAVSSQSSFQHDGEPGQILAHENTAVFAERALPAGVKVVQCRVHPGTDRSASWGPGIALVWPNRVVKFYLRPGKEELGVNDNGQEAFPARWEPGKDCWLRLRISPRALVCSASTGGTNWQTVHTIRLPQPLGDPTAVRLGKTSRTGGRDDYPEHGGWAQCRIEHFVALGDIQRATEAPRPALADVQVRLHYELYDGLPLFAKWLTVHNGAPAPVRLDAFLVEQLAVVEPESIVDGTPANFRGEWRSLEVFSDYAFGGHMTGNADAPGVRWQSDPLYETQVHYRRQTPCLLECGPPLGPDVAIAPGDTFTSFRVFELLHDSTDRERRGLAVRRAYRTLAPWGQENPILMHVRSAHPDAVKLAVDQCAAVGFEMVILTFGSGFNLENEAPASLAQLKELADYAHAKGIELGGYSLLASRRISDEHDVIHPETGRTGGARFGNSPCLGSQWGRDYFRKLRQFFLQTGCGILEHDGSYPGDVCASTNHPGHRGLNDSQWTQWRMIADFYQWCRGQGIYLNVPDWYYLAGSSKCGMGYRETNWSRPRDEQEIIERQNVYDGTWEKTPSMGWMFVPLVQYHGGGAAATLEPLKDHLEHYEARLANLFGAGVQACYRGPRLFDAPETKAVVQRWVDFYRQHRAILDSDLIHLRRPDGRDWDGWLHVNPRLNPCGLAMLYNPLPTAIERTIRLPLYYTGLTNAAWIREPEGPAAQYPLDRGHHARVAVRLPAKGRTWLVIEPAEAARFPGQRSQWNGFDRYDFSVDGRPVLVVAPPQAAPGKPWVWHGEFFGHKPAPDLALLRRGFHVVYMSVPDMLGCPEAVAHWNALYRALTGTYGFAKRAALVGLSRGGLYCYNWAIANPDQVACIYGDAPVCDFKSWPGGQGKGRGSPRDWELVRERYHFASEAAALAYPRNPVDQLAPLARARVPLLHVYGDADDIVPWEENTGVVAERYRALGGEIALIAKPGVGHHPHGLEDSTPIVEFLLKHALPKPARPRQRQD